MLLNLLPAAIMFLITVAFATLFLVPVTKFPQKNELINFYWAGFWLFLVAIVTISGGVNTLMILDYNTYTFSNAVLFATVICFVLFVMFGWLRLSAMALLAGAKKIRKSI